MKKKIAEKISMLLANEVLTYLKLMVNDLQLRSNFFGKHSIS